MPKSDRNWTLIDLDQVIAGGIPLKIAIVPASDNVRPKPGENKQAQTQAVSRLYSHQCGQQYASSERGTIRRLALKVKTKSSV